MHISIGNAIILFQSFWANVSEQNFNQPKTNNQKKKKNPTELMINAQ